MKNLDDLFERQLNNLYDGEEQMIEALPKMIEKAEDEELKEALEKHLEETKDQKKRLEEIFKDLDLKAKNETCQGMKALLSEANTFIRNAKDEDVKNAGIIADAQKVEHYEISSYGTAVRFAEELGHKQIAKKLQTSLDEEYNADKILTKLAEKRLNKEAK